MSDDDPAQGSVLTAKLPSENQYSTGWVTQTIVLGDTIEALDYHDEQNSYVIGTSRKCDFKMPDTDILYDFGNEGDNEIEYLRKLHFTKYNRRHFISTTD